MMLSTGTLAGLALLSLSTIQNASAAAESGLPSVVLVLSGPEVPRGQNLSVALQPGSDEDPSLSFHAVKMYITHRNGTEMTPSDTPFGSYNLGNFSGKGWDDNGSFVTLTGDTLCAPKSTGGSLRTFDFDTRQWPAATYTLHVDEIVYHGGDSSTASDGAYCIQPPFSNVSSSATTSFSISDTAANNTFTSFTVTADFPSPTGTSGNGGSGTGAASTLLSCPTSQLITASLAICAMSIGASLL